MSASPHDGDPAYESPFVAAQMLICERTSRSRERGIVCAAATAVAAELALLGVAAASTIACNAVGSGLTVDRYGDAYAFRGGRVIGCYVMSSAIGTIVLTIFGLTGNALGLLILAMATVTLECALAGAFAHHIGLTHAQTPAISAVTGVVGLCTIAPVLLAFAWVAHIVRMCVRSTRF